MTLDFYGASLGFHGVVFGFHGMILGFYGARLELYCIFMVCGRFSLVQDWISMG